MLKAALFMQVVLASNNMGKTKEFAKLFAPYDLDIVSQSSLGINSIEETGLSFIENAILKARYASSIAKMPALADDSGLIVESLNGAPGLHSARFAGKGASSEENIDKLLQALKDVPDEKRKAYFYCVLVYIDNPDDETPLVCEGKWHGNILKERQGESGFGYDPIFWIPEKKCSAAELTISEKNQLSHRARATNCMLERLQEKLCTR